MADEDHQYTVDAAGEAGASGVTPMQCSSLRKNGHVILKDHPCKIVDMSTSKTGKHGHAKVHLVGTDIFDGTKYEDLSPSTHNMEVPNVTRQEWQLINIDGTQVSLMDKQGNTNDSLNLPTDKSGGATDIAGQLEDAFEAGKDVIVAVLTSVEKKGGNWEPRSMILSWKEGNLA